jgi:peptidoglycan/LPS O-acetylase OafA/YrhL
MFNQHERARYHELDALRGLAASIVVVMHFHDLLFGKDRRLHFSHLKLALLYLASPFRSGESAVTLFFVLSGFVLALPILAGKKTPYPIYALRRIVRIYLPYLPALLLAIVGDWKDHGRLVQGMWTTAPWSIPPNAHLIAQHMLLIGSYKVGAFNFVFWTLVIEMRISLVYPFLIKALVPLWPRTALLIEISLLLILTALSLRYPDADLLKTARFGCFFLIGFQLARCRETIGRWYSRRSTMQRTLLGVASLLGFGYNIALRIPLPIEDLVSLACATGIIVMTLCSRDWRDLLRRPVPQWLGQISYSLYLTHVPVLFLLYVWVGSRISNVPFLVIYLVGALSFATLFYYVFERPALILNKYIGGASHRQTSELSTASPSGS